MSKKSIYLDQASDLLEEIKTVIPIEKKIEKSIELTELIILEANRIISPKEKKEISILDKILSDVNGKAFFSMILDQCFRANVERSAEQLAYLLHVYGINTYLPFNFKIKFYLLKFFYNSLPHMAMPIISKSLMKEASLNVLIDANSFLTKEININKQNNIVCSIMPLLKKTFSEANVESNLRSYLNYLKRDEIQSLIINIKDLIFDDNLLCFESLKNSLAEKIKVIFRCAKKYSKEKQKSITIDFFESQYIELSYLSFIEALKDNEFNDFSASITLLSFFPQSFEILKKLITFSMERKESNFEPIIIRISKGLNYEKEQIYAAKNNWPQAIFPTKTETDSNFLKMIQFSLKKENIKNITLKISTLNIFDISYSLITAKENNCLDKLNIELLIGRGSHIRKAIKSVLNNQISYLVPVVRKKEFVNAGAFLLKRLDLATQRDNFSTFVSNIVSGCKDFEELSYNFKQSALDIVNTSSISRQYQNRLTKNDLINLYGSFENEAITDFSVKDNRIWADKLIQKYKNFKIDDIPFFIEGKIYQNKDGKKYNLNKPDEILYHFSLASKSEFDEIASISKKSFLSWSKTSLNLREDLLENVVTLIKANREKLIAALMLDISKTLIEADSEICDAIDAILYHKDQIKRLFLQEDIDFKPIGSVLIIPSYSFPISVAAEIISASLICANSVIVKPILDTQNSVYELVKLFWDANIPKNVLQYVNISKDLLYENAMKNSDIDIVKISTNAKIAKKLIKKRDGLHLSASTGGINTIIVTALADREDAINKIVDSAFSFSGQKFSSASILIVEKEVFEDQTFLNNLREKTNSLKVSSPFDLSTTITPLLREDQQGLADIFTKLEENEKWLLEPKIDENNPKLFYPGIKIINKNSCTLKKEIYAPILSIIQVENLKEALDLVNSSKYALCSGLFSLDPKEQHIFAENIQAGNIYINSKITDAKIRRQPFGGYKDSFFGNGYKSGGPNYILDFLKLSQKDILPKQKKPVNDLVNSLTTILEKIDLSKEELGLWYGSISNYSYWYNRLKQESDPSKLLGQDNILKYIPRDLIILRLEDNAVALDALRVCAATLTCSTPIEISYSNKKRNLDWIDFIPKISIIEESEDEFIKRIVLKKIKRVRLISKASEKLKKACAQSACFIIDAPVLANGRFELLHYLKEISITNNYDRYGHLGIRDGELRSQVK